MILGRNWEFIQAGARKSEPSRRSYLQTGIPLHKIHLETCTVRVCSFYNMFSFVYYYVVVTD